VDVKASDNPWCPAVWKIARLRGLNAQCPLQQIPLKWDVSREHGHHAGGGRLALRRQRPHPSPHKHKHKHKLGPPPPPQPQAVKATVAAAVETQVACARDLCRCELMSGDGQRSYAGKEANYGQKQLMPVTTSKR